MVFVKEIDGFVSTASEGSTWVDGPPSPLVNSLMDCGPSACSIPCQQKLRFPLNFFFFFLRFNQNMSYGAGTV